MRRSFLSATGWFLLGLFTLPLLYVGTHLIMVATAADEAVSVSAIRAVEDDATPLFAETELVGTKPVAPIPQVVHPPRSVKIAIPAVQPVFVDEAVEPEIELPAVDLEPDPAEFAQADAELKPLIANDSDPFLQPFSPDPNIRRQEFGFDAPPVQPKAPDIVLPVKVDSLANDAALDEAAQTKVKELRETLKKVVEEKAAKLSAVALEAEIQLHQRHLSDLNALQELLRLEQGLKELGDKFPESDSGLKAKELLKSLEHLRNPKPLNIQQTEPDTFGPSGANRSSGPNPFAFDQQQYKWLRGTVNFDASEKRWLIYYGGGNQPSDSYHGHLKMQSHKAFHRLKPGDTVYVEGNVDTVNLDRSGKPTYKVNKLSLLRQ